MKIENIDICNLPIWACAIIDEINEMCRKRLMQLPEYRKILKESSALLEQYRFISTFIDRDEIEESMDLSVIQSKALSQFLALDSDREEYERIQLYLMGCQHTIEMLQLLDLI